MQPETESQAEGTQARFLGWVSRLVHEHRARLVNIARSEGLTAQEALDCAQDAFQSFLCLPQARLLVEVHEDSAKLLTVLCRNIARNQRRKHHRARPHETEETLERLPASSETADEVVQRAEEYVTMVGCLATLNQIQKAVVGLRLIDDVPGEDVARMLGISAGHVAVLLHRARQKLRGCLPEDE